MSLWVHICVSLCIHLVWDSLCFLCVGFRFFLRLWEVFCHNFIRILFWPFFLSFFLLGMSVACKRNFGMLDTVTKFPASHIYTSSCSYILMPVLLWQTGVPSEKEWDPIHLCGPCIDYRAWSLIYMLKARNMSLWNIPKFLALHSVFYDHTLRTPSTTASCVRPCLHISSLNTHNNYEV